MASVIIGIGIPGSGKSTLLAELAQKYGYELISIDEMKKARGGVLADNPHAKDIWNAARSRMKELLAAGKTVIFDSTFTTPDRRAHFLKTAHDISGTVAEGIYFDIPLEHALERNRARGASGGTLADEQYIRESHALFQKDPPTPPEGFDVLVRIDENSTAQELKGHPNSALTRHFAHLTK